MSENRRPEKHRCHICVELASEAQNGVNEVIDENQLRVEGLRAIRFQLLTLFGRIERLHGCIDKAFSGQPFLHGMPPDAAVNRQRFNTYFDEHRRVTNLLARAIELWMLTCNMKCEMIRFQ